MDGHRLPPARLPVPARRRGRRRALPGGPRRCSTRSGVPSRELSVDEAREIVPQLDTGGLLAATFCELDGYATPEAVVQWYARGARRRGRAARSTGDRRRGTAASSRRARRRRGTIATGTVVCCAGVWSAEVGALAGVEHPGRGRATLRCSSRRRTAALPRRLPLTIDFSTGFYFHREGPALVVRRPRADARGAGAEPPRGGCRFSRSSRPVLAGGATTR